MIAQMSRRRRILAIGGLIAGFFGLLCIVGDPLGALLRTGPYNGRVVDAETGAPVAGAFVLFGWGASPFIGENASCSGGSVSRTNADGRFHLSWQGYRFMTNISGGLAPPTYSVLAVGYKPWGARQEEPKPLLSWNTAEPVRITSTHGAEWTDADTAHIGICESSNVELLVEYIHLLSDRASLCNGGAQPERRHLALLMTRMNPTVFVVPADTNSIANALGQPFGELQQPVCAALDIKMDGSDISAPPLLSTAEQAKRVCALLDVRAPVLEKLTK